MAFVSTRGNAPVAQAAEVILRGLAPDGGLYVPQSLPQVPLAEIGEMRDAGYVAWAKRTQDFTPSTLGTAIETAYSRFNRPEVTPLVSLSDGAFVLELFHGPTLAFKDVALQLLPHLSRLSKEMTGEARELFVLVATSGDTGKAALEGFVDVPGTRCAVFFPEEGVSEAQRLQMLTQPGSNTHVIAVEGNFDDTQTGVKRIFQDADFAKKMQASRRMLSSANSINFGRLAPQVVYYFYAYAQLLSRGVVQLGDPAHFAVPTGNFGNILAGYYARRMGLPIGRLICASNANHILADFMETGVYDTRRDFQKTLSPSMDILISSNLERLLFDLADRNAETVRGWMASLRTDGRYDVGEERLRQMQGLFLYGWADDEATREEIRRVYGQTGYLLDTHTAVASRVLAAYYRQHEADHTPCVMLATASPFKFGRDVLVALGGEGVEEMDDFSACEALASRTGLPVPPQIAALPTMPILHHTRCEKDGMEKALLSVLP